VALTLHEDLVLTLASILRDRRELMDISQSDLARRSGLHRSYIGDLERGSRNISVRNLSRLAHAMSMQPSKLLALAEKRMSSETTKGAGRSTAKTSKSTATRKKAAPKTAVRKAPTRRKKATKAKSGK
jgi:transcriptional regulator with XRE-family HTH domain